MLISHMILVLTFTVVAALTAFLAANERSHAKPHYFFIFALISIGLGYGFKIANDAIEEPIKIKLEKAQHLDNESEALKNRPDRLEQAVLPSAGTLGATLHALLGQRQAEIQGNRLEARKLRDEAQFMSDANVSLKNISELMLLVSGAFAGALASAAITNRAKLKYDARTLDWLESLYAERVAHAQGLAHSIKKSLSDADPDENTLQQVEVKRSELAALLDDMALLSSRLTQKELDAMELRQPPKKALR